MTMMMIIDYRPSATPQLFRDFVICDGFQILCCTVVSRLRINGFWIIPGYDESSEQCRFARSRISDFDLRLSRKVSDPREI